MPQSDSMFMKILATIAVACAVTVTVFTLFRGGIVDPPPPPNQAPVYVDEWRALTLAGHREGPESAPVTILEFADFECPVCRQFTNGALRGVRDKYGDSVSLVFRHWPLRYHRFAYPAARAAECAGDQHDFFRYHDLLYKTQDSLGLIPFEELARRSGIQDTAAYSSCLRVADSVTAISRDVEAAARAGGHGTPTILVNGMRLPGAPDSAQFDRMIREAIDAGVRDAAQLH